MPYLTSVGLDAHARSIAASALVHETGEVRRASFGYDPAAVAAWVASLPQPAHCVYESGPGGFALQRSLAALGVECAVGAVTKMVRPSGDRVKTDARDADLLARMLATGCVVECRVPTPSQEAARDLARARADAREDLMRARNRLSKMLLRKGIVYPGKSTWTKAHMDWLGKVALPEPCERFVLSELLAEVASCEARRGRLDAEIARVAALPEWAPVVSRLRALRGVGVVTAFSVAAEIGDFSRFATAEAFMSYLGLVPSESSSGESSSRGPITRTGNGHVRTLLVEAAWHHARAYSPSSPPSLARLEGLGPEAARVAAEANRRLHSKAERLRRRNVNASKANVAVARELAGFVWALANCEG